MKKIRLRRHIPAVESNDIEQITELQDQQDGHSALLDAQVVSDIEGDDSLVLPSDDTHSFNYEVESDLDELEDIDRKVEALESLYSLKENLIDMEDAKDKVYSSIYNKLVFHNTDLGNPIDVPGLESDEGYGERLLNTIKSLIDWILAKLKKAGSVLLTFYDSIVDDNKFVLNYANALKKQLNEVKDKNVPNVKLILNRHGRHLEKDNKPILNYRDISSEYSNLKNITFTYYKEVIDSVIKAAVILNDNVVSPLLNKGSYSVVLSTVPTLLKQIETTFTNILFSNTADEPKRMSVIGNKEIVFTKFEKVDWKALTSTKEETIKLLIDALKLYRVYPGAYINSQTSDELNNKRMTEFPILDQHKVESLLDVVKTSVENNLKEIALICDKVKLQIKDNERVLERHANPSLSPETDKLSLAIIKESISMNISINRWLTKPINNLYLNLQTVDKAILNYCSESMKRYE